VRCRRLQPGWSRIDVLLAGPRANAIPTFRTPDPRRSAASIAAVRNDELHSVLSSHETRWWYRGRRRLLRVRLPAGLSLLAVLRRPALRGLPARRAAPALPAPDAVAEAVAA
jgi:hypothetical protein